MLLSAQARDHLIHQVVDIQQLQLHRWVVDRVRQVVGHRMAERRHRAVVVGPAPFAEQVRETVHQHPGACVLAVAEEQVLARLLAAPVLAVAKAAGQRGLLTRAEHHRAGVVVPAERVQQRRGEAEIALHELGSVLWPVHAREVEHEVCLGAPAVQFLGRGLEVVFIYFRDGDAVVAGFAVADVLQLCAEVSANEAFGAGYKYLHSAKLANHRYC